MIHEQVGRLIEAAIAAAETPEEAQQFANEIVHHVEAAQKRRSYLYVRGCRLRCIERAKDPYVAEALLDIALRDRETPGFLGTNGAWQRRLWALLGKDGTRDLLRAGFIRLMGDTVEFFDDALEALARGTFDPDAPWVGDDWTHNSVGGWQRKEVE